MHHVDINKAHSNYVRLLYFLFNGSFPDGSVLRQGHAQRIIFGAAGINYDGPLRGGALPEGVATALWNAICRRMSTPAGEENLARLASLGPDIAKLMHPSMLDRYRAPDELLQRLCDLDAMLGKTASQKNGHHQRAFVADDELEEVEIPPILPQRIEKSERSKRTPSESTTETRKGSSSGAMSETAKKAVKSSRNTAESVVPEVKRRSSPAKKKSNVRSGSTPSEAPNRSAEVSVPLTQPALQQSAPSGSPVVPQVPLIVVTRSEEEPVTLVQPAQVSPERVEPDKTPRPLPRPEARQTTHRAERLQRIEQLLKKLWERSSVAHAMKYERGYLIYVLSQGIVDGELRLNEIISKGDASEAEKLVIKRNAKQFSPIAEQLDFSCFG